MDSDRGRGWGHGEKREDKTCGVLLQKLFFFIHAADNVIDVFSIVHGIVLHTLHFPIFELGWIQTRTGTSAGVKCSAACSHSC